ncbi:MAG: aminotransferase class I/II-fold pyridoxal phosphate-dependent enzyme [Clostridiales bacterium]|nr:aminotransferase class I/II-fold pyridoxal phosphate-dependent enzyme [Clostridiales bacterium]
MNYLTLDREALLQAHTELQRQFDHFCTMGLSLNMARGKPSPEQLDLSAAFLNPPPSVCSPGGVDGRNYSVLEDLPEMRRWFADLLGLSAESILLGGNSSLNLMYDSLCRLLLFGKLGSTPWCRLEKVKWLCPSPGYDRHFAVTEHLGFELITVPMTPEGPDMDLVERLVAGDAAIKGIWCVPLYANPQGACYSDETVERLAAMETAAEDFTILWDNAYGVHHVYEPVALLDILEACARAGHADRVFYYFSTSKISFPGAGVSMMAMSPANRREAVAHMTVQTIGPDKLNQLRLMAVLPTPADVEAHMKLQADRMLRPRFDIVLEALERELGGTGLAEWISPRGGYFVAVDTLEGCAARTVALAGQAGVVMTGAGATFPYKKDPRDSNIRVAPSYPTLEELRTAMSLFCVCVKLAGVEKLLEGCA